MSASTHQRLPAAAEFDLLLEELTSAWWAHQQLRAAGAPLADLATSGAHLFQARVAMGCWRRRDGR